LRIFCGDGRLEIDWLDVPDFISSADAILEIPWSIRTAAALELRRLTLWATPRTRCIRVAQWRGAGDPGLPRPIGRACGQC